MCGWPDAGHGGCRADADDAWCPLTQPHKHAADDEEGGQPADADPNGGVESVGHGVEHDADDERDRHSSYENTVVPRPGRPFR